MPKEIEAKFLKSYTFELENLKKRWKILLFQRGNTGR
jgi:hypothetical protein